MGYNTEFRLLEAKPEHVAKFREMFEGASHSLDEDGGCEEPAKWYQFEADLAAFSKSVPGVTFIMHGIGEGDGDIDTWRVYARNGRTVRTEPELAWPDPPDWPEDPPPCETSKCPPFTCPSSDMANLPSLTEEEFDKLPRLEGWEYVPGTEEVSFLDDFGPYVLTRVYAYDGRLFKVTVGDESGGDSADAYKGWLVEVYPHSEAVTTYKSDLQRVETEDADIPARINRIQQDILGLADVAQGTPHEMGLRIAAFGAADALRGTDVDLDIDTQDEKGDS